MNTSRAIGAVFVAIFAMASIFSHAAYMNEGGSNEIRIVGKISPEGNASGLGRNVMLREAVRQVVPADYSVRFSPGVDQFLDKKVTWKGGRPWSAVLTDMILTVPEITVEIDATAKVVTLSGPENKRVELMSATGKAPVPVVEQGGGALRTWTISVSDRYIRVTLKRWAKEAGYELVWDVNQDIEVDVDSVIRNKTFDEAFLEVMNSLAISDFPVEAVIYENRVIRIVKLARKD